MVLEEVHIPMKNNEVTALVQTQLRISTCNTVTVKDKAVKLLGADRFLRVFR